MTSCLDEEAILSFGRGNMAIGNRSSVEAHVAECDECRVLVSAIRRASFVDPTELGAGTGATPAPNAASAIATSPTLQRAVDEVVPTYAVEEVVVAGGIGVAAARPALPVLRIVLVGAAAIGALVVACIVLNTMVTHREAFSETATTSDPGALVPAAAAAPAATTGVTPSKSTEPSGRALSNRK